MKNKEDLLNILLKLKIAYERVEHEAINNVREGARYAEKIDGAHCKNLFLQDALKKAFLAIVLDKKTVDLKKLAQQINSKRLSFASLECLEASLGVKPGCVTPLALINDSEKAVTILIDQDIMKEKRVHFHPLVNTETLTITLDDFMRFLTFCGNNVVFCTIPNSQLVD